MFGLGINDDGPGIAAGHCSASAAQWRKQLTMFEAIQLGRKLLGFNNTNGSRG